MDLIVNENYLIVFLENFILILKNFCVIEFRISILIELNILCFKNSILIYI